MDCPLMITLFVDSFIDKWTFLVICQLLNIGLSLVNYVIINLKLFDNQW